MRVANRATTCVILAKTPLAPGFLSYGSADRVPEYCKLAIQSALRNRVGARGIREGAVSRFLHIKTGGTFELSWGSVLAKLR
jgi:hypothetical protein